MFDYDREIDQLRMETKELFQNHVDAGMFGPEPGPISDERHKEIRGMVLEVEDLLSRIIVTQMRKGDDIGPMLEYIQQKVAPYPEEWQQRLRDTILKRAREAVEA